MLDRTRVFFGGSFKENFLALIDAYKAKPSGAGDIFKEGAISSTMGVSVRVDQADLANS